MTSLHPAFEIIASHDRAVHSVTTSRDGQWLLTGDTDRQLTLWHHGEQVYTIDGRSSNDKVRSSDRIRSVVFSPDAEHFFVASGSTTRCFRTSDGHRVWQHALPRVLGFLIASPLCLDMSVDGLIAVANDNATFGVRDLHGRKLRTWRHNSAPRWLRWMTGGESLVGSDSFSIRQWDAQTGETVCGYFTEERVYNLVGTQAKPRFAVRTLHGVQVYEVGDPNPRLTVPVQEGLPLLGFSPDGERIVVCSEHGLTVGHIRESEEWAWDIVFDSGPIASTMLAVTFSHDGRKIFAGCLDGTVLSWTI